jgi:hypothetical protein
MGNWYTDSYFPNCPDRSWMVMGIMKKIVLGELAHSVKK